MPALLVCVSVARHDVVERGLPIAISGRGSLKTADKCAVANAVAQGHQLKYGLSFKMLALITSVVANAAAQGHQLAGAGDGGGRRDPEAFLRRVPALRAGGSPQLQSILRTLLQL